MKFRFLVPHHLDRLYEAGETADLPLSFVPNGGTEPLDQEACLAFYRCGPQPTPNAIRVVPRTRWHPIERIPGGARWKLTGLGADLPDVCG